MTAKVKAKLTKRTVDAVQPPTEGEVWIWDTDIKGLILRVRATGRKVYALRYRLGSRQVTYTIGTHGSPWTPDAARDEALKVLGRVRDGEDPTTAKKAAREALTVNQLIAAYLDDGPATKPEKRASTWAIDGSNLKRHVGPLIGRKLADSVTNADAARVYRDIANGKTATQEKTGKRGLARVTGGEGTARRTKTTAAAMYAWGIKHGLVKTNPFASVKLTAAPVQERFLSDAEAAQLLDATARLQAEGKLSATFADATRLLLLSGARRNEVLGLRWSEIVWDRRELKLPPARTKAGGKTGERRIVLSPPAVALLERRRAEADDAHAAALKAGEPAKASPFVFPAARGEGHAVGLRKAFFKVVEAAGIDPLRVHDLRHSFASFAIADGASLFLVSKLLGHSSARTAERYAHLAGDPLQDAAAAVGRRFQIDEGPSSGGEVIPMTQRR